MYKLFLSLAFFLVISCNSASDTAADTTKNADTTAAAPKSYTWDSQDEKEYLAQCVETAKANVNDTTAYARCKCVLDQLKQVYPSMDSAFANLDSAAAVRYAANCQ
jgi:hypothetical protein